MNIGPAIRSAGLTLAACGLVWSSGQAQTASPTFEDLQHLVAQHGRVAYVTKDLTLKSEQRILRAENCQVDFQSVQWLGDDRSVYTHRVDLRQLSPEVMVDSTDKGSFSIEAPTSSGERTIPFTAASTSGTSSHEGNGFTIFVPDREAAGTVASALQAAVQQCGGQPQSDDARAVRAAADARDRTETDRLLGNHIPDQVKANARDVCWQRLRDKLRAPSTANFDSATIMPTAEKGGLLIVGNVEAQNAMGGIVRKRYICTFEEYGKQYVPTAAEVY